jgi:hypothetical protein
MSKKPRKPKVPQQTPKIRRRRARHTEWLWIAAAFLILGGIMIFARRGTVVPVPEGTPGAARGAALVNAPDMRVYGWLNLALGFASLGGFVWMRKHVPTEEVGPDEDDPSA